MAENNFSSLVQQKMANVNAASAQKQAAIDPSAYAAKTLLSQYANGQTPIQQQVAAAAAPQPVNPGVDMAPAPQAAPATLADFVGQQNQIRRANLANAPYGADTAVSDAGDKLMGGVANTLGMLGQIAPTTVGSVGSLLNNIDGAVQNAIAPEVSAEDRALGLGQPKQGTLGNDILALTGGMQKRVSAAAQWLGDPWRARVSEQGQVRREKFDAESAAITKENDAAYRADKGNGDGIYADLKDIGRGWGKTIAHYADNPDQILMDTAENLPQLGANIALGGTSVLGNATVAGLMEASGMYDQVKQDINKMSDADLLRNSAMAQQLQAQGYGMQDIRDLVTAQATGEAAPIQAALTMAAAPLGSKLETGLAGKGFGKTASERIRERAAGILGEGADETLNSATGAIAGNYAAQNNYNPDQRILEGVGEQAAQGGLVGLGMAGVTAAPGQAVDSAIVAARASGNAALRGLGALRTSAEARRDNNADNQSATEDSAAQAAAFTDAVNNYDPTAGQTNAEETSTPVQEAPTQTVGDVADTQPADIPAADTNRTAPTSVDDSLGNIFTPEGRDLVTAVAGAGGTDAQQLAHVAQVLQDNPDMPAENRRALEIYANDRLGNLLNHRDEVLEPAIANAATPEEKAALENQKAIINTIANNPQSQRLLDTYSPDNVSDEEFNATLENLPAEITPENVNTPEVQNSFTKLKEMSLYRPLDIAPEQYQRVLDHDTSLTPEQRTVLQAKQVAATQFQANNNTVSDNIRNQSRKDFKSVRDHAAGIFEAMAQKNPKLVYERMQKLRNFAQGMVDRANAHSAQMRIINGVQNGEHKDNRYTEIPGLYQLNPDGSKGKAVTQFVTRGQKGAANVEAINNDAAHAADVYNAILRSVPNTPTSELVQAPARNWNEKATPEEIAQFEQDRGITKETPNAEPETAPNEQPADTEVAQESGAPVEPGVQTDESKPADTSSRQDAAAEPASSTGTVQSDVVPATYDQPALSEADARELPDDQIADLMTEAQNHIAEQGFDKTAQDNFRTLSDEMARREATPTTEDTVESEEPTDTKEVSVDSEKAAPVGQQILDKVPETNAAYDENGTPAEKSARTNQLRATFQARANGVTNYVLGFLNNQKDAGVKRLQENVRSIAKAMNRRLAQADAKFKISEKYNTAFPAWAVQDRKAAYATVLNENGKVAYIPEIQEAFGLAATHWALNAIPTELDRAQIAELLGMSQAAVTPELMRQMNEAGLTLNSVAAQVASMAEKVLGIQAKKTTSKTYGRNITNAIAREVLDSMADAGLVTITPFPMPGRKEVVNMIRVNTTDAFTEMKDGLGGNTKVLEELLLPNDRTGFTLGENKLGVATRVNGDTWQEVPPQVQRSIEVQQNQPYLVNKPFRALFEMLATHLGVGALVPGGYADTSAAMNDEHRASVEGKNAGLVNAMKSAGDMLDALDAMGEDTPIHWEFVMDTNGRTRMAASINPQSNKLFREMFSATNVDVDTTNEQVMREFYLHLAQGLGVKVDKMSNDAAIQEVSNMLANDLGLQAGIAAMEKGLTDGWDTVTKDEAQAIVDASADKGNKFLHTMLSAAKYNVALLNGDKTFNHAVTFEVDGVTDGPANSFVHYGMVSLNKFVLKVLRKVGWNVNQPDMPSNIAYDPVNNPDMYITSAANIYNYLKGMDTELSKAFMSLLTYAGLTQTDGENNVTGMTRSFAKLLVTPGTYGSGSRAMTATLVNEIVDNFYSHLSDVLAGRDTLDTHRLNNMDLLFGTARFSKLANASERDLTKFKVTDSELTDTYNVMNDYIGNVLFAGIDETVGGALQRNKEMAGLTNIQGLMFKSAWEKAYNELQAKRIAAGELAPNEMLSQADEDSITKELQHLAPIYQNGITGDDVSNGFNMGTMNPNGVSDYMNDGTRKKARVTNLMGGLATNATGTEIGSPGVRTVALATISGGDATMMTRFFNAAQRLGLVAQNVYDGLDTRVGDMEAASDAINQAVAEGWQTDLYLNIITGTKKALGNLDLAAMSDADLGGVIRSVFNTILTPKQVKESRGPEMYQELEHEINNMLNEHTRLAEQNAAVRRTLLEAKSTISHMGGVDKAYNHGSQEYTGTEDEQITAMRERAREIYEKDIKGQNTYENDDALLEQLTQYGARTEEGVLLLTKDRLMNALATHDLGGRVTRELFKRLAPALSDNLQVFHGTPEQITELQHKMFPGVAFNENANATTYGNVIFLRTANNETLFHEAIHAGIQNVINQSVADPESLSEEQRGAVNNINTLMNQFLKLSTQNGEFDTKRSIQYAQNAIQKYLMAGDVASALNEFVAWSLANQNLQEFLGGIKADPTAEAKSPVTRILRSLKNAVLRMLGWPATRGQSVLEALAGNFDNLVQTIAQGELTTSDISNALDHSTVLPDHVNRLDSLVTRLDAATRQYVKQPGEILAQSARDRTLISGAASNINAGLKEFLGAGWNLSPKEQHAFQLTQVLLASRIQLNPTAMNAMQRLYDSVMPTLTTADMTQAQLDALTNDSKTTQLANFMALGVTSQEFRQVLANRDIPRREQQTGDYMQKMTDATKAAIDWMADLGNGTRKVANSAQVLDALADKIADINFEAKASMVDAGSTAMQRADTFLSQKLGQVGEKAGDLRDQRVKDGKNQKASDQIVNGILSAVEALDKNSAALDTLQSMVNSDKLWRPVRELVTEMLGTSKSSMAVNKLLQQAKNQVSAVRQKIRETVPKNVQSKFSRELTRDEWATLTRAMGRTDVQALLNDYSLDDVKQWLADPAELAKAVAMEEGVVGKLTHGADYLVRSKELAHYMMTGDNISDHLLRNAEAIANLHGTGKQVTVREQDVAAIDNLTSLYALQQLSEGERTTMASLFDTERSGLDFTATYLKALNSIEAKKALNYTGANGHKGAMPSVGSSHKNLVVADAKTGENLVKNYGYVKVPGYVSDGDLGNNSLSYYFTTENLTAGYTQGALQTVEPLLYGTDPVTGRTTTLRGSFGLTKGAAQAMARQKKQRIVNAKLGTTGGKLMPVFNSNGEVVAYEAPISHDARQEKVGTNTNLSELLGVWQGRQTEETLAQEFNKAVAQKLADVWKDEKGGPRKGEYIDLAKAAQTSKVEKETWDAIPRSMQKMLADAFGGPVMVRMDMLNNAFGYRNFSVAALFTNQTDLPTPMRNAVTDLATVVMGAKAARYLRKGERLTQNAVSIAKDWIIVRSVTVFTANLLGNFIQLGQNGVGLKAIFKGQAAKMQEVDAYLRNINKQQQLFSDNLGITDPAQKKRNEQAIKRLEEANARMSIAPLIAAGELPTVAEGLTIEDDDAIRGGALNWMEAIIDKMPKGVSDAAKLALIAKGTPLHNGLNRMMTYGDFVAKAVLFDKLTKQDGKSAEDALRYIQEEFINYDNNPGRTRTYMESMGFTWFLTYKLKIQKILLRRMRDNPLSTLVYQGVANGLGIDSPFEANVAGDNFWYSFSDPTRALSAPSLHPVAQLLQ